MDTASATDTRTYDLIVVGAGSGNMIPGPEMDGWKIAIVEPDRFGGTCLNRGCIPSKMLIYSAEVAETIRHAGQFGVHAHMDRVDWGRVVGRVWERIDPIADAGAEYRRSLPNVDVYDDPARFVGPRVLESGGVRMTAEKIVLAAGSRPIVQPIPGIDEVPYHTSDTIMRLEDRPERITILGGGYIGAEMAHFFGSLGVAVTIVDHGRALLKAEDDDISRRFTEVFSRRFNVLTDTVITGVAYDGREITVDFQDDERSWSAPTDVLLLATGRIPNSDLLNVEASGIEVDDRGRVRVNEFLETSVPGVYAFGDLTSELPLKHAANLEARALAAALSGNGEPVAVDYAAMPHAVFGSPQVAGVGLTERAAQAAGVPYAVARRDYADTAYGWASAESDGFVKLIADPETRLLLGAHIIGPHASMLLQPLIQGMKYGQTVDEMARVIYIHPALTEVVEQALLEL